MLDKVFHRAINPYVYQLPNNKIGVVLKAPKNLVSKVIVFYGDGLSGGSDIDWEGSKEVTMKKIAFGQYHDYYEAELQSSYKRFRYSFLITNKNQETIIFGESGEIKNKYHTSQESEGFTYSYWDEIKFLNAPKWYRKTNWYQIFPDRFNKQNIDENWNKIPLKHEIYGGTLQGIISKLDYIKEIGFNGIYITPIFKSSTSHRYDTIDYYKIDKILGTKADFKNLVKECKKRHIKIMMDAVFNHIGAFSKQWQDVIKNKTNSKYYDWFWINNVDEIKQPNEYTLRDFHKKYPYETFSIVPEMPRLKWANPEVEKYLLNAAKKWTKMGIDGWRLDVAFEPNNYFWRKFKNTVSKINKNILIIGEVLWDSVEYLRGDIWHGVMNYPLRKILLEYLLSNKKLINKKMLIEKFNDLAFFYSPEQQWGMFNLFSSHDVVRLITILNKSQKDFELANKMLFSLPGSTSTYYGEESNLEGRGDPDNRRTINWKKNIPNNKEFYKKMFENRKKIMSKTTIFERCVADLEKGEIIFKYKNYKIKI